jgi:hypothetical protein
VAQMGLQEGLPNFSERNRWRTTNGKVTTENLFSEWSDLKQGCPFGHLWGERQWLAQGSRPQPTLLHKNSTFWGWGSGSICHQPR